jgi:hypothetical protein
VIQNVRLRPLLYGIVRNVQVRLQETTYLEIMVIECD